MNESNSPKFDSQDAAPATQAVESSTDDTSLLHAIRHVLQIAVPLMISTGTASIVLFADRTLLLYYGDGSHMSAAMAGGNMYWTLVCFPIGIASMTGAIVAQYIGSGRPKEVGRFLWQSAWLAALAIPFFAFIAWIAPWCVSRNRPNGSTDPAGNHLSAHPIVRGCGVGARYRSQWILQRHAAHSRDHVVQSDCRACQLSARLLVYLWRPWTTSNGIAGAAIASVIAFWIKAIFYIVLLLSDDLHQVYATRCRAGFDAKLIGKLFYFGTPAGLQHLAEAGGFTAIILQIDNSVISRYERRPWRSTLT